MFPTIYRASSPRYPSTPHDPTTRDGFSESRVRDSTTWRPSRHPSLPAQDPDSSAAPSRKPRRRPSSAPCSTRGIAGRARAGGVYAAVPACHGFGECRSAKPVSEPEGGGGLAGAGRDGPTRTGPATVAITKFSCSGGVRAANVALHDLHGGTVRVAPSQREACQCAAGEAWVAVTANGEMMRDTVT